jgi:membrane protease YdiL (CAAX protease family)
MGPREERTPRSIPAVFLIHQEGVIGIIALVGLSFRTEGLAEGLAANGSATTAILAGIGTGALCALSFWLLRRLPALADLVAWQRNMVRGWSMTDAMAVAVFSGLAEEALIRALLQPLIGLVPAAILFAALHFIPDRRLWLWPVVALLLGILLGALFEFGGYPAAAAAHIVINAFSLLRLQRTAVE